MIRFIIAFRLSHLPEPVAMMLKMQNGALQQGRVSMKVSGGQTGIRTLETVTRLHTFQACAFDHSATCPLMARLHNGIYASKGKNSVLMQWPTIQAVPVGK
jgi:hypothetical protein